MFLNVSWQVWAVLALIVVVALYLLFTEDEVAYYDDLAHYDGEERPAVMDADAGHPSELSSPVIKADPDEEDFAGDPYNPMSAYYSGEQNLFDGRADER